MKNSLILKNLRKHLLLQLVLPLLLLSASLFFLFRFSCQPSFSSRALKSSADFAAVYDEEHPNISMEAENLHYTGFDCLVNGRLRGFYYYTLADGRCQFYLLKAGNANTPEPVIARQPIKGTLTAMDSEIYKELTAKMALTAGWTMEGVQSISSPYLVSSLNRFQRRQILSAAVLALCLLTATLKLLLTLFYLFFPLCSPPLKFLRRHGGMQGHLTKAEMEMKHTSLVHSGSLWLTPNYLVKSDGPDAAVIPLETVVRVYCHGRMKHFFGRKRSLQYSLHVVTSDHRSCGFCYYPREFLDNLITALSEVWPDILTGYSDENKKAAEKK